MIRLSALLFLFSLIPPESSRGPEDKLSLIYFSGSDWCTECILFERKVLRDTAFAGYLKRNSIDLERIDFPQRQKLSKEH